MQLPLIANVNGIVLLGSIFPNFAGSLIPSAVLPPISTFPEPLQWWAFGAPIAAVFVGLDYFKKIQLNKYLSKWIQRIYSSKTLLGVFIATMFNIFQFWWVFVLAIWAFATYKLKHKF